MPTITPRYGLIKNEVTDYQDDALVQNQGVTMDKIDQELGEREDELTAHKTAATLDHPNSSVTDEKIGSRTVADASGLGAGSGLLGALLNGIGYVLRAITGKANWWTAPAISLETLNAHAARHQPGSGTDALPTAAPLGGLGTANATGSSASLARADHQHLAFDGTSPVNVGTASAGSATVAARRDHSHALADGAVTTAKIGDNQVTDAKIGSRTVGDTTAPSGAAGLLGVLLNGIGYILKAITGKTNWWTAPAISLETLNAHAARHQPGSGTDALPTAAPAGGLSTANGAGSSTSLARADHQHLAFDNTNPVDVGDTASPGTSLIAARRDHRHKLDAGSITDAVLGNRTISDASAPGGDVGLVAVLLSWLAYQVKALSGKENWKTAPAITLEVLSSHKARHQPNGADPLTTAAPNGGLGTANTEGSSTSFSRADHGHLAFDSVNPANISDVASPGTSSRAARRDHVHAISPGVVLGEWGFYSGSPPHRHLPWFPESMGGVQTAGTAPTLEPSTGALKLTTPASTNGISEVTKRMAPMTLVDRDWVCQFMISGEDSPSDYGELSIIVGDTANTAIECKMVFTPEIQIYAQLIGYTNGTPTPYDLPDDPEQSSPLSFDSSESTLYILQFRNSPKAARISKYGAYSRMDIYDSGWISSESLGILQSDHGYGSITKAWTVRRKALTAQARTARLCGVHFLWNPETYN